MATEPLSAPDLERLQQAIARLPPRRRNIFLLCRVEGWTSREIAQVYGIAVWRVRRHVSIAMRILMLEVYRGKPQPWWRRWGP